MNNEDFDLEDREDGQEFCTVEGWELLIPNTEYKSEFGYDEEEDLQKVFSRKEFKRLRESFGY